MSRGAPAVRISVYREVAAHAGPLGDGGGDEGAVLCFIKRATASACVCVCVRACGSPAPRPGAPRLAAAVLVGADSRRGGPFGPNYHLIHRLYYRAGFVQVSAGRLGFGRRVESSLSSTG